MQELLGTVPAKRGKPRARGRSRSKGRNNSKQKRRKSKSASNGPTERTARSAAVSALASNQRSGRAAQHRAGGRNGRRRNRQAPGPSATMKARRMPRHVSPLSSTTGRVRPAPKPSPMRRTSADEAVRGGKAGLVSGVIINGKKRIVLGSASAPPGATAIPTMRHRSRTEPASSTKQPTHTSRSDDKTPSPTLGVEAQRQLDRELKATAHTSPENLSPAQYAYVRNLYTGGDSLTNSIASTGTSSERPLWANTLTCMLFKKTSEWQPTVAGGTNCPRSS